MENGRFADYTYTKFMSDFFFLEIQHVLDVCVCKKVASKLENFADTSVSQDLRPKILISAIVLIWI